jgi:hypothetical protein
VVLLVWLSRRAPERLRAVTRRIPEWRPAWIAFIVLAVLGYALNDSGITVPGVMLAVFVPTLVFLLAYVASPTPAAEPRAAPTPEVLQR